MQTTFRKILKQKISGVANLQWCGNSLIKTNNLIRYIQRKIC